MSRLRTTFEEEGIQTGGALLVLKGEGESLTGRPPDLELAPHGPVPAHLGGEVQVVNDEAAVEAHLEYAFAPRVVRGLRKSQFDAIADRWDVEVERGRAGVGRLEERIADGVEDAVVGACCLAARVSLRRSLRPIRLPDNPLVIRVMVVPAHIDGHRFHSVATLGKECRPFVVVHGGTVGGRSIRGPRNERVVAGLKGETSHSVRAFSTAFAPTAVSLCQRATESRFV